MFRKLRAAYLIASSQQGRLFTYAFAYSLIAGIAPFLILAVFFAGQFLFDVDAIVSFMSHYVPEALILPFVSYIKGSTPTDLVVIISLTTVSLWVASRTIYSFLLESSRIDEIGVNNFILRIASMIYFILFIMLGLGIVLLYSYLPLSRFQNIVQPVLIWVLMMMFFRMISFRFVSFFDVWKGALFSAVGLLLLGKLFFLYINQYSNYETIYGPMASFMILLISCYFISWIVYGGYCINLAFYTDAGRENEKKKWLERVATAYSDFLHKKIGK